MFVNSDLAVTMYGEVVVGGLFWVVSPSCSEKTFVDTGLVSMTLVLIVW